MTTKFDRKVEDLGNVVALEHVNIRVPDQRIATLFYITGLGLTRDPYLVTGVENMWVNVGRSQFHLPTGKAQIVRGRVGLVFPDQKALRHSLARVAADLKNTKFAVAPGRGFLDVVCPWGNKIRCYQANGKYGPTNLGMVYVMFNVPMGTARGIARFYEKILCAPAKLRRIENAPAAQIDVGNHQTLIFRETKRRMAKYDGHHFQLYVSNFSGPYAGLIEQGLITEESDQHQYRFQDIIDPEGGEQLFTIEHEIRSMTHPLYGRPLINRNPGQTNFAYVPGHDSRAWATSIGG